MTQCVQKLICGLPLKLLKDTLEKMADHHYSVDLLWKERRPVLPFTKRSKSLENKFKKDPEFHETYIHTMEDYTNKGHASKISLEEFEQTPSHTNYIPNRCVKNVNKSRKVRAVFDVVQNFNQLL